MVDQVVELDKRPVEEGFVTRFLSQPGGQVVHSLGHPAYYDSFCENPIEIYWVTEMTAFTSVEEKYMVYGNEPSAAHCYGKVCLVVRVEPAAVRLLV